MVSKKSAFISCKSTKSCSDMIRKLITPASPKSHPIEDFAPIRINKQNHELRKSERSPRCISIFHRLFTLRISSLKFVPPSLWRARVREGRQIRRARARVNPSWASENVDSGKREILARCRARGTFLRGPSAEAVVPLSHPRLPTLHYCTTHHKCWCTAGSHTRLRTLKISHSTAQALPSLLSNQFSLVSI